MRTIRIKAYKFEELSDQAKETAREAHNYDAQYSWADEAIKSLEAFGEHFSSPVKDYSIDWLNSVSHSHVRFDVSDELSENDIEQLINKLGSYDPETLRGNGDCVLTGYAMDESLIDGIRKSWHNGIRDLEDLLSSGVNRWLKDCKEDFEYELSAESFSDSCEANGYEFTKEGKQI